jgi:hypothetical protein
VIISHPKIKNTPRIKHEEVREFMAKDLNMNPLSVDLITIEKFGKGDGILLEFPTVEAKKKIFRAKKKLRMENSPHAEGFYINEFLSRKNIEILKAAKDM